MRFSASSLSLWSILRSSAYIYNSLFAVLFGEDNNSDVVSFLFTLASVRYGIITSISGQVVKCSHSFTTVQFQLTVTIFFLFQTSIQTTSTIILLDETLSHIQNGYMVSNT